MNKASTLPKTNKIVTNKLVVIGDGCCGKTSLLQAYLTHTFSEFYVPTICENFTKEIKVSDVTGETAVFSIWDTAGQEDYDKIRKLSYNAATGIIICFAIDNPDSLINVKKVWAPEVRRTCPGVPYVLVATKTDLRTDGKVTVPFAEGKKASKLIKAHSYVECSAKNLDGVETVFETAAKATFKTRPFCVIL